MNSKQSKPLVHISRFDLEGIEERYRFDAWRENMGAAFEVSPAANKSNLTAEASTCLVGGIGFGKVSSKAQPFTRDKQYIARDDTDHIMLQLFLKGGCTQRDIGNLTAGDMIVIDMAQPIQLMNSDFTNLTLVIPRDYNVRLSSFLASLHCKRLSRENPTVRLLGDHMFSLWNHVPHMNMLEANRSMYGALGLIESWLSQEGSLHNEDNPHISLALGDSIRQYIDRNLSETITVNSLTEKFRVSRSQIYRIFAPHEGVASYIWKRRLVRSYRLLRHPHIQKINISTIAYDCGFSSESHFSQAFKSHFGSSPKDVRAQAWEEQLQRNNVCKEHSRAAANIPSLFQSMLSYMAT